MSDTSYTGPLPSNNPVRIQVWHDSTPEFRPSPGDLLTGELILNYNTEEPGLYFKTLSNTVVKVGPSYIGSSPPNSQEDGVVSEDTGLSPYATNSEGELWVDTSQSFYVLRAWHNGAWLEVSRSYETAGSTISLASLVLTPLSGQTAAVLSITDSNNITTVTVQPDGAVDFRQPVTFDNIVTFNDAIDFNHTIVFTNPVFVPDAPALTVSDGTAANTKFVQEVVSGQISNALSSFPISSINGQTGTITITPASIGTYTSTQINNLIAGKEPLLSFTPLNPANNLSDVANTATARANLGLTNVPNVDATNPANIVQTSNYQFVTTAEITAWNAKQTALGFIPLNPANNLSDVSSILAAKTNLGLNNVVNLDTSNPANIVQSSAYRFVTDSQISTWNSLSSGLGFTPLNRANNLSDLASVTAARTNLGLGASALQPLTAFLQPSNNLSDLSNFSAARTNLGLNNVPNIDTTNPANIVQSSSYQFVTSTEVTAWNNKQNALGFTPLNAASNLADLTNTATARTNLNVYSIQQVNSLIASASTGTTLSYTPLNAADNLSDLTNPAAARTNLGLGTLATANSTSFLQSANNLSDLSSVTVAKTNLGLNNVPNVDATNPANIIQNPSYRFTSDTEKATWNGKQNALGFTPLNPASNLSDVQSPATARTNLGLGSAATLPASAFLQASNNLSEIVSPATARSNLGLGAAATQPLTTFLQASNNLSDVPSVSTARTNLGLGTAAIANSTSFLQASNNLSDLTNVTSALATLGVYSQAQTNTLLAGKQAALGFTPLNAADNLSDLTNVTTARSHLGLGTAATANSSSFLQASNNLSDLVSITTAKANLGLNNVPNIDATNPANIVQSSAYRFVTDSEIATWNSGTGGGGGGSLGYTAENVANKGVANGYAELNSLGLVPDSELPTTDHIAEGSTNLYFTTLRVINTLLGSSLNIALSGVVQSTDSLVQAISKLQNAATAAQASLTGKEPTITAGTTSQYWRGDKTWQTLNSDVVAQGTTNLYSTPANILATSLTGLSSSVTGTVLATDSLITGISKLQNAGASTLTTLTGEITSLTTTVSGKEPAINAGLTTQYWRGDKTWHTLNSDAVPQGTTNQYFTNAAVLSTPLSGLNTSLTGSISSSDTVESAAGRLQSQISAITNPIVTYTNTFSLSLADGANYETTLPLSQKYILTSVTCTIPIRIRFYLNSTYQTNDLGRSIGISPTGDVGLLFEGITSTTWTTINLTPIVIGIASSANIPVTITNVSGNTITSLLLSVTYIQLL